MNLADVMDELKARLASIGPSIRPYAFPVDQAQPPAAVVTYPDRYDYDATYQRGDDQVTIPVVVLVGKVSDRATRDTIAKWCAGSGPESIKAVLEGAGAPSFVSMPAGGGGQNVQTNNRPALPTGEADPFFVAVDVELVDWTPASSGLVSQYLSTFNLKGWLWRVTAGGAPEVQLSSTGANDFTLTSATPYGFTDNTRHSIGAHIVPNDGAGNRRVTYYTMAGPGLAGPWVQHGAPVQQAGAITIFGTSSALIFGAGDTAIASQTIDGKLYDGELRSVGDFTAPRIAYLAIPPLTPGVPAWLDPVVGFAWSPTGDAVVTAGPGPAPYTAFDSCRVQSCEFDTITVGGVDHLAATFAVDIIGTGD